MSESMPRANVRGASTRARLLEAALSSFASKGFHGTGTRDISEGAGMSPAAVYAHFASKEEVLFRLSLVGHADVRDRVVAALERSTDPVRQLVDVVRDFAAWHAEFHTRARVVQYELAELTPEHFAQISELRRQIQTAVVELIAAGRVRGVFEVADPRSVARAILSLGIDVARWYDPRGELAPSDIGVTYADLALRMVGYVAD